MKNLDSGEKAIVAVILGTPIFILLSIFGLLNWVFVAAVIGLSALSYIANR